MSAASKRVALAYHASMLADRPRVEAYRRAIEQSVEPGDVVVDLGAGTGVLSFIACQAGAARVYAIEAGPVVDLARELAAENGLGDRVVFLEDLSYRVELPERADVLITETLWNFGLGEGMIGFIADARERFLKPNARIIPTQVDMELAAVEEPGLRGSLDDDSTDRDGLSFARLRHYRSAHVYTPRFEQDQLLSAVNRFPSVDVRTATDQEVGADVELVVERAGSLDGLGGWFAATLADGVEVTNRPGDPDSAVSWQHAFFPLARPVPVVPGDTISVNLRSAGNGAQWHWRTRVERAGEQLAADDQTTFFGFPPDRRRLAMRSDDARPELTEHTRVLAYLLERFDGTHTIASLVDEVATAFPGYFHRPGEADRFVREAAERYARLTSAP